MEQQMKLQEAKIKELEKSLKGVQGVVHQLIGGLYNQRTQEGSIDTALNILNSREDTVEKDTSPWGIWPTTRQGDALEGRINALEIQASKDEGFANGRMNALECRMWSLEENKAKQQAKIDKLEEENKAQMLRIAQLEFALHDIEEINMKKVFDEIFCLKEAVREIGARLLNQHTQKGAWRDLKTMFYHDGSFDELDEQEEIEWSTNTSKWGDSFTTPQGDENERKIARIEEKLRMFSEQFK